MLLMFEYNSIQFEAGKDIVTAYLLEYSSYFEYHCMTKVKTVTYSHNINPV